MADWRTDITVNLNAFLAEYNLSGKLFTTEYRAAPHTPPSALPAGKMGIYGFYYPDAERWLKIGKVGPNSAPRWISHHYWESAPSTLSKSIRSDPEMAEAAILDKHRRSEWIKKHTCRANIIVSASVDQSLLSQLEQILHLHLNPKYEGRRGPLNR